MENPLFNWGSGGWVKNTKTKKKPQKNLEELIEGEWREKESVDAVRMEPAPCGWITSAALAAASSEFDHSSVSDSFGCGR